MRLPWNRNKPKKYGTFSGNCLVREFTGDGVSVGRCYYSTYDGICPRHGDVLKYLLEAGWPRDFELPKYDGGPWAEKLREKWAGR